MKYGLSAEIINQLQTVFQGYADIESVYMFGSRAAGTFRDGSDIDLAVIAPAMTDSTFTALWNEVDALPLVFKVDCIHLGCAVLSCLILLYGCLTPSFELHP